MFCESKFPHMCVCVNRMMWAAGAVAAMSSITFPAVSALVSQSADPDKQGESLSLSLLVPSITTRSPLLSVALLGFLAGNLPPTATSSDRTRQTCR